AALLTEEPVILRNIPLIADILDMLALLEDIGVKVVKLDDHVYQLQAKDLTSDQPSPERASRIRGSFLLAGSMLNRYGSIHLPAPGGDKIGIRPVSTHLQALKQLGASIVLEQGTYHMETTGLRGADVYLDEASVMATENVIMAAVMAWGGTTIYNAACEPHVQGLCHMLIAMGARITGIGSNMLTIDGVAHLHGCDYTLQPDHIEVGSFIGLAAVTRSELLIKQAGSRHLRIIRMMFERLGVTTEVQGNDLLVPKQQEMRVQTIPSQGVPKIDDAPWPGFPADLTSIMTVVATQCTGTVLIFEKMFESRLFWVDKLIAMGAHIILCDPHRAVISGPCQLTGIPVSSPDIRAGMSLLIAALGAQGVSVIQNIHQIDRGYENIDIRLQSLGARIQRK
ncbi:MAG: UDP-N-acetylglucosamine 1-carboxyvinyltransferase, partial [SAR324 cluster bacterium]|nr:UDP-N-acetylglucosamine 1-carboxyvinyltransferase [SAR324 cluster bacterium]